MNTANLNLGRCCACGTDQDVVNLICLPYKSPYGWGWGCAVCGLSDQGAIAVLCDDCIAAEANPREFVKGEIAKGERAPFEELADAEPWQHDLSKHPEFEDRDLVEVWQPDGDQWNALFEQAAAITATHGGLPYWRNEASGKLQPAIEAFIDWGGKSGGKYPPPTPEQTGLIIQYFQLWANFPGWQDDGNGTLPKLRAQVQTLATAEDCDRWLMMALELGIDPL